MNNYEVTFIVDPVLSNDEIESTSKAYQDLVSNEGCTIVNVDRLGLKQLAYPINKRSSGVYYCIEFQGVSGAIIPKMELAFRRDERIMRFLSVRLDRYGVQYNEDKRAGKIGTVKKDKKEDKKDSGNSRKKSHSSKAKAPVEKAAPAPAVETAPAVDAAPVATPVAEATPPVVQAAAPVVEAKPPAVEDVKPAVVAAAPVVAAAVSSEEE